MNSDLRKVIEPRWPIVLTISVVFILLVILPERVRVVPAWLARPFLLGVIFCTIAVPFSGGKLFWRNAEKRIMFLFFVLAELSNCIALIYLIQLMMVRANPESGLQLLTSSVAVWLINVLAFSLLYWQMDRGGPESRKNNNSLSPDWLFTQNGNPEYENWSPSFADYLFLSYTSATAFSPTDAMPVSGRAKMLMMLESSVSLITIIVVVSKAIGILGS